MILFLDIGLPVVDGYELAARLRDVPELHGITLFAVTGYGQDSDRQKTRAAGFAHHFVKPIDLDVIEAVRERGSHGDTGQRTQSWLAVSNEPTAMVSGQYWYQQRRQQPASDALDVEYQDPL